MKDRYPFFSIIVPTYNRPAQLANCLQSLVYLDYPRERYEVIVVDDGSQTPTETVVSSFTNRLNITLIEQPHSGPAMARNEGVMHAKGEFLAFTDDDCTPAPDWLKTLAVRFIEAPDRMVGGRSLNMFVNNPYSTASDLLIRYLYAYYNTDPDRAYFLTTNNLALPIDGFRKIGGFDTLFLRAAAEDREFCERWLRHGFRMTYAPEVLIYHAHRLTLSSFCRQQFNYGRGAFRFHQLRARHLLHRFRIEAFPFYVNLLRHPLSEIQGKKKYLFFALMILSQGVNAAGFLWEMGRQIVKNSKSNRLTRTL